MTTELADSPLTHTIQCPPPYEAIVIASLDELEPLRAEWDGFLKQANAHNLCLTHGWLVTWLTQFPQDKLHVVIVTDAHGQWVGVAPLKVSRSHNGLTHRMLRHVQFIGTHPTVYDWMKIVVLPGADEAAVLKVVANSLHQAAWDVLDLMFMPDRTQAEQLCAALGFHPDAVTETTPMPYIELPATEAEYEPQRRKKTRLEVNRHSNRFAKEFGHPPTLEFQAYGEASDAILTRFFAGHVKYWSEKGHKSDFQRFPNLYLFYKEMLTYSETQTTDDSEPKLLFSVLKMDDQQLSYHLGFWQGNGYLSHITHFNQGFKGYSPGTIHMDRLIFDTLARGGREFEFGRGDEPYKKLWTKEKKSLWNLRLFRHPIAQGVWNIDILLKKATGKACE